jgi:hypothetical protein
MVKENIAGIPPLALTPYVARTSVGMTEGYGVHPFKIICRVRL